MPEEDWGNMTPFQRKQRFKELDGVHERHGGEVARRQSREPQVDLPNLDFEYMEFTALLGELQQRLGDQPEYSNEVVRELRPYLTGQSTVRRRSDAVGKRVGIADPPDNRRRVDDNARQRDQRSSDPVDPSAEHVNRDSDRRNELQSRAYGGNSHRTRDAGQSSDGPRGQSASGFSSRPQTPYYPKTSNRSQQFRKSSGGGGGGGDDDDDDDSDGFGRRDNRHTNFSRDSRSQVGGDGRSSAPPNLDGQGLDRLARLLEDLTRDKRDFNSDSSTKLPPAFLRGVHISPFTGEHGQYFAEWLEAFEAYLIANNIAPGARATALRAYLKGSAARRVSRLDGFTQNSYIRLCDALREEFDTATEGVRQINIAHLHQKPEEQALDFVRRVQDQVDLVHTEADDATREMLAVSQVKKGVFPEYMDRVPAIAMCKTMAALREQLLTYETANRFTRAVTGQVELPRPDSRRKAKRHNEGHVFSINRVVQESPQKDNLTQTQPNPEEETAEDKAVRVLTQEDVKQVEDMIKTAQSTDRRDYQNVLSAVKDELVEQVKTLSDAVRKLMDGKSIRQPQFAPDNRGQFKQPPVGALADRKCWRCGGSGHMQYVCRVPVQTEAGRQAMQEAQAMFAKQAPRMHVHTPAQVVNTLQQQFGGQEEVNVELDLCGPCESTIFRPSPDPDQYEPGPEVVYMNLMNHTVPEAEPQVTEKPRKARTRKKSIARGLTNLNWLLLLGVLFYLFAPVRTDDGEKVKNFGEVLKERLANAPKDAEPLGVFLALVNPKAESDPLHFQASKIKLPGKHVPLKPTLSMAHTTSGNPSHPVESGFPKSTLEGNGYPVDNETDTAAARLRHKFGTFFDRKTTAFGRNEAAASQKVKDLEDAYSQQVADEPPEPGLTEIFGKTAERIGAVTNLGLGAAAVPEGLAIVSSTKAYFPVLRDTILPQWSAKAVKRMNLREACQGVDQTCERILDPRRMADDCPGTSEINIQFSRIVDTLRAQYEGSVDTSFYAEIMTSFCHADHRLCTGTNSSYVAKKRVKREPFTMAIVGATALASLLGLTGMGLGISSSKRIEDLESKMATVLNVMDNHNNALKSFKKGLQRIEKNQELLTEYVTESLGEIYEVIEDVRCAQYADMFEIARQQAIRIFRNYIQSHIDAIVETSQTGRLTPRVLGVEQLKEVLSSNPTTINSLIMRQPSLAYQFGRVFPVKLDWDTLTFGFVLEVPNPTVEEMMPVYKIFNVGFYRLPNVDVYRAPLPHYVVMDRKSGDKKSGLIPLDEDLCTERPGLRYCPIGAASRIGPGAACLRLFLGRDCPTEDCDDERMCSDELFIDHRQRNRTAVITTIAGLLIRTHSDRVRAFQQLRTSGVLGRMMPRNEYGTYWMEHSKFVSVTVGNMQFASIGQVVRVTRVVDPLPFNISTVEVVKDIKSHRILMALRQGQSAVKRRVERHSY
jgi:hypothetical protein